MAFQKRLDCASNGFQIAAMPRVPRSAKGKRSARKKGDDSKMSAFDLLATIAGKLLAEREGFGAPSKEQLDNDSPFKGGVFDQGSSDESTFAAPSVSHGQASLQERIAAYAPTLVKSHQPQNGVAGKNFFVSGSMGEFSSKSSHSTSPMESCMCKVHGKNGSLIYEDTTKMCNVEGPIDADTKPPVLVSSDSSVEFPPYGDCGGLQSSFFSSKKGGKEPHHDKDDGENSSVCTHPAYIHSKIFKPHCLEAHRRRKLMKSSYRKADPALCHDREVSKEDVEMKPVLRSPKLFYTRQRTPRSSFKRRKLFERCSISPSLESSRGETILDSIAKDGLRLETNILLEAVDGAIDTSCSTRGPNSLCDSEDHPVKLSIKSFKVPELAIEIPVNATVGLLKRTVTEAVMAILGDGLHVGVLLHGKNVRDDNKTLRQAGISYEDKMDSLDFTLEPSRTGTSALPTQSLNKFQASDAAFWLPPLTVPTTSCDESEHENSVLSPVDPPDNTVSNSKALVPLAAVTSAPMLSVVPFRKSRRSEITQQRRIRRPFSVSEVEALVQAVEKLGTGRWRDVKLQAFDNAKHRTYVDLKDKWKTLVHTARISPQQRRGEPVPQGLLDRVLSAHSFWSHQQAKIPDQGQTLLLTQAHD